MICFVCGSNLSLSSNFMRSECGMIHEGIKTDKYDYPIDENDDALVATYNCSCCGTTYEVGETTVNERKNEYRNYWKQYEQKRSSTND